MKQRLEGSLPQQQVNAAATVQDQTEDDGEIGKLIQHSVDTEEIIDLCWDKEEDEEENHEQMDDIDISAAKIKSFKAIIKKILNETSTNDIRAQIRKAMPDEKKLTEKELTAMVRICTALQPYIPPKAARGMIAFCLPLVILANIVQHVAGYGKYARQICPFITPATIHSLHLDAAALYEIMSAKNFIIADQNNHAITSVHWVIKNKVVTLGSFLDLTKISSICSSNGLVFQNLIVVNSDDTADLVGGLQLRKKPAISYYDGRRKMKYGKEVTSSKGELTKSKRKL
jgi:hypothetical protein